MYYTKKEEFIQLLLKFLTFSTYFLTGSKKPGRITPSAPTIL
jgi:hypothetical protein